MSQLDEKDYVKVAIMYYEEGMTQAQIAKEMGVSRSLISKILIDSNKNGLVEVHIRNKNKYAVELERELEKKLKLDEVLVIDTHSLNDADAEKKVSQESAYFIIRKLKKISSVGVSWGKSIRNMVDSLPFERMDQLEIYPLIGGMGDSFFEIHSNQICHDLAMKLRAKANYLYSPALIDNHELKKAILDNNVICNVIQSASEVDLAIVGLSNPNSEISTMRQIGYISDQDVDSLFQAGAVGDINSYFFDKDGHQLDHIINDQVIGLSINEIKKINEVLVIVSDINKFDALLAALKESIFTTLIITDEIGDKLIETINEEQSRN